MADMLDPALLRQCAKELDVLLKRYAPIDAEVATLQTAIQGHVQDALQGRVRKPLTSQVPGERFMMESSMRETHPDLTHAFALFAVELTGGLDPALIAFKARRGS